MGEIQCVNENASLEPLLPPSTFCCFCQSLSHWVPTHLWPLGWGWAGCWTCTPPPTPSPPLLLASIIPGGAGGRGGHSEVLSSPHTHPARIVLCPLQCFQVASAQPLVHFLPLLTLQGCLGLALFTLKEAVVHTFPFPNTSCKD